MGLSIAPLAGRMDAAWTGGASRRPAAGRADDIASVSPFAVATPADGAALPVEGARPVQAGAGTVSNPAAAPSPGAAGAEQPEQANGQARSDQGALTPEEQAVVRELKARDAQVRAHEQAHVNAAAGLSVSGPTYSFQRGPDGRNYAVGGEVRIDTSEEDTPRETADKAQRIQAAALAPADPSPQDRAVAAAAAQMEQRALQQISAERQAQAASARTGGAAARGPTNGQPNDGAERTPGASSGLAQQRLAQTYGAPGPRMSRWLAAA
jgi:hypothetical protein